jgi:antitoxin component of RelBE/YafQ-DinJ toxin-antitoxin module
MAETKEYATIQIDKKVKEQVVDYCNRNGLKIGRFIEMVFLQMVSGSNAPPEE